MEGLSITTKLNVGIIGCGGIANGKHLPSLSNLLLPSVILWRNERKNERMSMVEKERKLLKIIENYWEMNL